MLYHRLRVFEKPKVSNYNSTEVTNVLPLVADGRALQKRGIIDLFKMRLLLLAGKLRLGILGLSLLLRGIMKLILRWLATALAVGVALWLVPGISILGGFEDWGAIILFALILSLVNMVIKPILQALSLPITVLTLGLFYLVVNAGLLYFASWVANGLFNVGFSIESFGSAFFASIVISIVSALVNAVTGANDKDRKKLSS